MRVRFRRLAKEQVKEIEAWYEAEQPGLGEAFSGELSRCIATMEAFPRMRPLVLPGVRKAIMQRFPYSLLYTIENEEVVVLSVFHQRRDPNSWEIREPAASWMPRPKMQIPRQHPVQGLAGGHVQIVAA
jgi:plasmid stabilization system protein ParE